MAKNANINQVRATFVPSTMDVEARTIDVVFATATPVLRYSWSWDEYYEEILSMDGADLSRAERGLPVLDNHKAYGSVKDSILGRAADIRRDGDQWVANVRFSERPEIQGLVDDIRSGIITDISFGYQTNEVERMERSEGDKYRKVMVTRWTPMEISFVNIPADPKAGVRSEGESNDLLALVEGQRSNSNANINSQIMKREQMIALLTKRGIEVAEGVSDEELMRMFEKEFERSASPSDPPAPPTPEQNPDAAKLERARVKGILEAVRNARLENSFAEDLIERGVSLDAARAEVLSKLAESDPGGSGQRGHHAHVGTEAIERARGAMGDALMLRANPASQRDMGADRISAAREFRGMTLLRLAEEVLNMQGVSTRGMSTREIAQAALGYRSAGLHTTSDFPILLTETFNRTLRAAYALYPRTFQAFCRQTSLSDFRSIDRVQLSGLVGNFDEVVEGGEYKAGTLKEAKETYKLAKYGRKVGLTWESIINDDLDAFSRVPQAIAQKAYQRQSQIVYSILLDNPKMSDGKNLFNIADHANFVSNGTALSEASLDLGIQAVRFQKSLEGDFMNLNPRFLIVGPKNQLLANKLTSTNFVPDNQGNVPSADITSLTPIVDPRITDYAWFLATDPGQVDTIEYAFLDGEPEIFTEMQSGFDVDGMEIKARMVFAAKAIDYRGLYRNNGAAPSAP